MPQLIIAWLVKQQLKTEKLSWLWQKLYACHFWKYRHPTQSGLPKGTFDLIFHVLYLLQFWDNPRVWVGRNRFRKGAAG
uniref:Uncharacterized protein n=1 Tax=Arundo donax TaxID=35708 RepID=A0A0A9HE69_ARUDO